MGKESKDMQDHAWGCRDEAARGPRAQRGGGGYLESLARVWSSSDRLDSVGIGAWHQQERSKHGSVPGLEYHHVNKYMSVRTKVYDVGSKAKLSCMLHWPAYNAVEWHHALLLLSLPVLL
jgi:hypothetical protein